MADKKTDRSIDNAKQQVPEGSESTERKTDGKDDRAPNILQVIASVFAAFIGIQNKKNKERDFKHGNFKVFVAVAAIFTLLFLLSIFTVVQIVLNK